MSHKKISLHSICRWTFNAGAGGFVPSDIRPSWASDRLNSAGVIKLIEEKILTRLPGHVKLGYELHYDNEVNESNAKEIADALTDAGMYLAMITPGAHIHFAYGGVASLDASEREQAEILGAKTVDLAYGALKKAWHPDEDMAPSLVIWNGSFGYDIASIGIRQMYMNLKESMAKLCRHEESHGAKLYIGFEPKPNEGHPAMLIPTVASALLFWRKLEQDYGISREKKGVNKEFGHTEMIGLDHIYDTVEEIDDNGVVHVHLNSQGYNDGIILGGPGKFDMDHGTRINGMNIAIAGLLKNAGYQRWKGHDMQPRPYDNEKQGIDRVVRSILSWEACEMAAHELDQNRLLSCLMKRETAEAEDMIRHAVVAAQGHFDSMYH
jgi:xylose isomerase